MLAQAEIIQDPAAFVELDPEMAHTLLDLKRAVSRPPLACHQGSAQQQLVSGVLAERQPGKSI